EPKDDPVFDHVPVAVAPDRVLGATWGTRTYVAGEHTGEEALGVSTAAAVLVQRRGVEDPGRVAEDPVLRLLGRLVALSRQVPLPMAPEAGPVGGFGSRMEGRGEDHDSRSRSPGSSRVVLVGSVRDCLLEVLDVDLDEEAPHLDAAGAVGQVAGRLGVQLAVLHAGQPRLALDRHADGDG